MSINSELINLIKVDIRDDMVEQLMNRFDEEIVSLEDENDPMRPSVFRDEFKSFLEESVVNSIQDFGGDISFGIGSEEKLGFSEKLDDTTTDGLRIIGTIMQGISGEYVLITADLAKSIFGSNYEGDLGRTGSAYLMQRRLYDKGVSMKNWPKIKSWGFSNFPGIPKFFDNIEIDIVKYITKLLGAH